MHISARTAAAPAVATGLALTLAACGAGGSDRPAASAPRAAAQHAQLVVVPNVTGKSMDTAHRLIRRAGLTMTFAFPGGFSSGYNEIPCVKIATQSPAPGELRPRGASVKLVEVTCRKVYPPPEPGRGWP
jgi:PASTA domain